MLEQEQKAFVVVFAFSGSALIAWMTFTLAVRNFSTTSGYFLRNSVRTMMCVVTNWPLGQSDFSSRKTLAPASSTSRDAHGSGQTPVSGTYFTDASKTASAIQTGIQDVSQAAGTHWHGESGDIYQANFTQRLKARMPSSPVELYLALRRVSPGPYGCYLNMGDCIIAGQSPELLLSMRGRQVETRPIKGTRPRGATPEEDARLATEQIGRAHV